MRTILILLVLACVSTAVRGQKYPERRMIRSGNALYEKEKYPEAETEYMRALEKNPASQEAAFNLSNSLYKQERYEEAEKAAAKIAADTTSAANRAAAYYNQGNALFEQRKLEEALEAYKNSMRLDPDDQEAKFNYAYTKKLLEKDKDNNGGGGGGGQNDQNDQNDQNQDQGQDQDQNQDQDQDQGGQDDKDNNEGQDQQQQDQNQGQDRQQEGEQEQQQGNMTQEEAERILDAMQGSEDNTKEKVDKQKAVVVGRSGKNW